MRCCAYEKASCEDDDVNGYATEEFSGLAYWYVVRWQSLSIFNTAFTTAHDIIRHDKSLNHGLKRQLRAIAVLVTMAICFFFTLLYIFTGKTMASQRRVYRYFVSSTYFVNLPMARLPPESGVDGDNEDASGCGVDCSRCLDVLDGGSMDEEYDDGGAEPLVGGGRINRSRIKKEAVPYFWRRGSDTGVAQGIPIARRTIQPVLGIRRPPAISYSQAHLFQDPQNRNQNQQPGGADLSGGTSEPDSPPQVQVVAAPPHLLEQPPPEDASE